MKVVLKRAIVSVAGFGLIILGLVLSVPGVPGPGLLVMFVGLVVLAKEFHWARRLIESLRHRFPRVAASLDRASQWLHRRFGGAAQPTRD
jgi:uncharacterized protein (TIGR02611 family)